MATIDDIRLAFQNILQRSGTEVTDAELNSYVSAVNSGALTLAQARTALINSPEGQDVQDVVRLYQVVFGRVPDQAGLNFQVDTLRGPATEQNIAEGLAASPEFAARFGGNTVNTAFINAVYQQVLGRAPAASEVDFYLNSGFSAARIALAFSEAPEFRGRADAAVATFLDQAGQGTATYTGPLGGPGGLPTNPGVPGTSFALTAAIDALQGTANNDTFTATEVTLQSGDSINGGAGTDTLRIVNSATSTGLAGGVLPTLTGVERVEVANFNNAGAGIVNVNLASATGVSTVALTQGGGDARFTNVGGLVTVEAAGNTANGGNIRVDYNASVVAGTTDVQNVSLNSGSIGILNVAGVETVAVTATGSANDIRVINDAALKTVTVGGAGSVTLGATTALVGADAALTFNASAATGNVTANLGLGAVTATGGAGNDRFLFADTLGTTDTVVGGAGSDTIAVTGADFNGAAVAGGTLAALNTKVTGVETLEFTGAAATTINGTTFTNTEITKILFNTTGTGAGAVLDTVNAAGATRTYAFGEVNEGAATINGTNGVTSFNVALEGTATNGANVSTLTTNFTTAGGTTQVGTGTINLLSTGPNGTVNTIETITGQSNAGTLTTTSVVITGAHDLNIGTAVAAGTDTGGFTTAANVNASAFTGKLNIIGSTGQDTIVGGSGNDIINATAGGDTYTGGAGSDTFVFDAVSDASSTVLTTITDFTSGSDKINVADLSRGTGTFNATAVNVSAAPDFTSALNLAAAGNGGTNGVTTYFQFGGNTFLVVDNGGGATFDTTTDAVVRLTGLVNLTATDIIA